MGITLKEKENMLLKNIAQKYSLELVLLFGSRVSGKVRKDSDYDVAYLSKRNLNLEDESMLIVELAPIFKSENIDLVNLRGASPLLFFAIFNECQLLYEVKPLIFYNYRAYSFKRYIENKPLYELKFKRLQERIDKIKI